MILPILIKVKNTFLRKKQLPGNTYAVETGTYCGEFLVLIKEEDDIYHFLVLPKLIVRKISKNDFQRGLKNKIVKFVQNLPKIAFDICNKQYQKIIAEEKKK